MLAEISMLQIRSGGGAGAFNFAGTNHPIVLA